MAALHPSSSGEFGLIARHFMRPRPLHHTQLGVGDDCALLPPPPGEQLAISTDMLLAGRHFFADADPLLLGHKALAVSLSDLGACGARPLGFTLALALPHVDDAWLAAFAQGLFALADAHQCDLIGGDTTRGPLNICITVMGSVPAGQAHLRSGAQPGDDIYVSHPAGGGIGDARLALHLEQLQRGNRLPEATTERLPAAPGQRHALLQYTRMRLHAPLPRVALGLQLRGIASACIDLSDGLSGDLGHILAASGTGALLSLQQPDGSGLLQATSAPLRALGSNTAAAYALAGGDDYELLFTAPPSQRDAVQRAAATAGTCISRIGQTDTLPGLRWRDLQGREHAVEAVAFDHFAG